jgi:uracil-DNA glycosylase family 4
MSLFKVFKSKETEKTAIEKAIFSYGDYDVSYLRDDELDVDFRYLSALFTRNLDHATAILAELGARGANLPSETALFTAIIAIYAQNEAIFKNLDVDMSFIDTMKAKNIEFPASERPVWKSRGPEGATVAFVGSSPSKLDEARGKLFSGPIAKTISEVYLPEVGLSDSEVYFTNIVPEYLEDENGKPREPNAEEIAKYMEEFTAALQQAAPSHIVALGKTAAEALGGRYDEWVPHPRAVALHGDSGEVARKLQRLADKIEKSRERGVQLNAHIFKSDSERQIVYGEVMVPEEYDSDMNWTSPEEIELAAHMYLKSSRVVGHEHIQKMDGAHVVESYIAPVDFELEGQTVKKGTWIMAVHVEDAERWEMVKSGDYTGFSIGATAKIDPERMIEDEG